MTGVDWPALMRLGMIGLRLPPDLFWELTPAELMFLAGDTGQGQATILTRVGLDALMARFPDADEGQGDFDGRD